MVAGIYRRKAASLLIRPLSAQRSWIRAPSSSPSSFSWVISFPRCCRFHLLFPLARAPLALFFPLLKRARHRFPGSPAGIVWSTIVPRVPVFPNNRSTQASVGRDLDGRRPGRKSKSCFPPSPASHAVAATKGDDAAAASGGTGGPTPPGLPSLARAGRLSEPPLLRTQRCSDATLRCWEASRFVLHQPRPLFPSINVSTLRDDGRSVREAVFYSAFLESSLFQRSFCPRALWEASSSCFVPKSDAELWGD